MASVGEKKKLVLDVGSRMGGLSKALVTTRGRFDDARAVAEMVVRGAGTEVEANVLEKLAQAQKYADSAKASVERAIDQCNTYASRL